MYASEVKANDLVLCDTSKEDLMAMVGHLAEMCRRRSLQINTNKSKMMELNEEERLDCEVCVEGVRLEHVLRFKYSGK